MRPLVDLNPTEIRLWYCPLIGLDDAARAACLELLDPAETARHRRYISASAADQFLVGRAALRMSLSRFAPIAPADWQFALNEQGKPRIAEAHGMRWLSFNISHSRGMVVCAFCRDWELGVDVEPLEPNHNLEVAERFFTARETAAIKRAAGLSQSEAFLKTWTLKEAVIKSRGEGLSLPLSDFEIDIGANPPRISFSDRLPDDPQRWQLFDFRLESQFQAAVAVRRPAETQIRLSTTRLGLDRSGVVVP
jgi:4'-phosphopantetheinyl transferase